MKKFMVEVTEKRKISFEVEAENEDDAKDTAMDAYVNGDGLQAEMLEDGAIHSTGIEVIRCIGEANGIVCEKKGK